MSTRLNTQSSVVTHLEKHPLKLQSIDLKKLQRYARMGLFQGIRRGIEKETLRTCANGDISQLDHPQVLGATLTHPHITTDYSESLLEFITPVFSVREQAHAFLEDIHRFTYRRLHAQTEHPQLAQEMLWPTSMPCRLQGNESIRIAEYGQSHSGLMKFIYRRGLDIRYGRTMQTIAGLHYNFSLPDTLWPLLAHLDGLTPEQADKNYRSARYFGLIRNFRRYSWLLIYLFGASPAVDKSFADAFPQHGLQPWDKQTFYAPYATSLRMSDLGYQNKAQASLKICFNALDTYIETLKTAIASQDPHYAALGIKDAAGEYQQLNANILQIENEYYSDIRPKRVARSGQKPTDALAEGGVEYIEVRCLDVNPFQPAGISVRQMRFVDLFLVFCLLEASPFIEDDECHYLEQNHARVVKQGRDPQLTLYTPDGQQVPFAQQAEDLFARLAPVAELLDLGEKTPIFAQALSHYHQRIAEPERTLSARMLAIMAREKLSFIELGQMLASEQAAYYQRSTMEPARKALFAQLVESSLQQAHDLEQANQGSFEDFLAAYFA